MAGRSARHVCTADRTRHVVQGDAVRSSGGDIVVLAGRCWTAAQSHDVLQPFNDCSVGICSTWVHICIDLTGPARPGDCVPLPRGCYLSILGTRTMLCLRRGQQTQAQTYRETFMACHRHCQVLGSSRRCLASISFAVPESRPGTDERLNSPSLLICCRLRR